MTNIGGTEPSAETRAAASQLWQMFVALRMEGLHRTASAGRDRPGARGRQQRQHGMRAITVRHPWAHAIVYLGKDVENRSVPWMWHAAVGERIAVHAGARLSARGVASQLVQEAWSDRYPFQPMIPNLTTSAVIGTVHVVGIHPASECGGCSPWAEQSEGMHHLELSDPQPCEPIRLPGKLGLWHLPADVTESIKPRSGDIRVQALSRNAGHNDRGVDRIGAC